MICRTEEKRVLSDTNSHRLWHVSLCFWLSPLAGSGEASTVWKQRGARISSPQQQLQFYFSSAYLSCLEVFVVELIIRSLSVSHIKASQSETASQRFPWFPSPALRQQDFVVWLQSAAIEEDDCDSLYSSRPSLTAGEINGKGSSWQTSWVWGDSALSAHCRLIKHKEECQMSSVGAVMHRHSTRRWVNSIWRRPYLLLNCLQTCFSVC